MRILMIGDIVGRPGRRAVAGLLPGLVREFAVDFVVANAENAAGGFGLTADTADEILRAGVEAITLGNHAWSKKEIVPLVEGHSNILRPINYPEGTPGRGESLVPSREGILVGLINVCGTTFMDALDCPFRTTAAAAERLRTQTTVVLVDAHAEATSEKMALARYLDGKVSAVLGTHTHVQTADEQILPGGTAYVTDCGMTGPVDSILGMKTSSVLDRFLARMPAKFDVASGPAILSGVVLDVDTKTGKATGIQRIQRSVSGAKQSESDTQHDTCA